MPTLAIKDKEKQLVIDKMILSNSYDESIDLTLLFTDLVITEDIQNKFYMAEITLHTEYDIREQMRIKGEEFLKVGWTTNEDDFQKRVHEFHILSIEGQTDIRENQMEKIVMTFIDKRYIDLMKKNVYEIFSQSTPSDILTEMLLKYDIELDSESVSDTICYRWMKEPLSCIDEVRRASKTPLMVFQQNDVLIARTFDTLFSQSIIQFNIMNINKESTEAVSFHNRIKDIVLGDILNLKDFFKDEVGNQLFQQDLWNKEFLYVDNKLADSSVITDRKKQEVDYDTKRRVDFPDFQFVEDYIQNNFIQAIVPYGDSNLYVGMLINIDKPSKYDKNDTDLDSGDYLIWSLTHKFNRDLNYSQDIVLVKKDLFKAL